jgi:Mrp family chromosome partitioning ATPase
MWDTEHRQYGGGKRLVYRLQPVPISRSPRYEGAAACGSVASVTSVLIDISWVRYTIARMSLIPQRALELSCEIADVKRIYMAVETLLRASASESPCIAVTSSLPQEGKTMLTASLAAISAGMLGRPVLAADLNWHHPALHQSFRVDRKMAASALAKPDSLQRSVQPSGLPNLDVLAAPLSVEDPAMPAPGVGEVAAHIVRQARAAYAMTFLDCHSVFPANRHMIDPLAVARGADLVLLVVLAGVTTRQDAKRARVMLSMSGTTKMAAVINQWRNPLA